VLAVIETATSLIVSKATVYKVMSAYTNHRKTISAKKKSRQKSELTVRYSHTFRRIVSKNRRTTAAQEAAELNIHLEDPVFTKTV
jgi:hypothetical protein